MSINYSPTDAEQLAELTHLLTTARVSGHLAPWRDEVWQDYAAPFIRSGDDGMPELLLGTYGMIPKDKLPPGVRLNTMNAEAETIGEKECYSKPWRAAQTCLLPTACFYEPNWESGSAERWAIGMADGAPFCVAGLWRAWGEEGAENYSFTQISAHAGDHALMKRFRKPNDAKRGLVIVPRENWGAWLNAGSPEIVKSMLTLCPAELMKAWPTFRGYDGQVQEQPST